MRCADMLSRMPDRLKQTIAADDLIAPFIRSGQELHELLMSPQHIRYMVNALSPLERLTLILIISRFGIEPFDVSLLEASVDEQLTGAEIKVGAALLRRKGLLYKFRKSWGEGLDAVPIDLFPLLQQSLMSGPYTADVKPGALQVSNGAGFEALEVLPDTSCSVTNGLAVDLFRLFVYIAQKGLPLTQKGTIHKRHIQKLSEELELKERHLQGIGLRYACEDVYPRPLAVIMDLAFRLKLIEQTTERISLCPQALGSWLCCPDEQRNAHLYSFCVMLYAPPAVWMQHAAMALQTLSPGRWGKCSDLLHWLKKYKLFPSDLSDEQAWDRLTEQWLLPMSGFGWLELGFDEDGERRIRWVRTFAEFLKEGENSKACGFYVQPDFELIVPPNVPLDVRWEIECMCDHLGTEQVSRYHLSKESLFRALESGRSISYLITLLEENAIFGMPDNVSASIKQWGERFGTTHFEAVTLLRCRDEQIAHELADQPALAEAIIAPIGTKDFIVREDRLADVMNWLDCNEYCPGKRIVQSAKANQTSSQAEYPLFFSHNKEHRKEEPTIGFPGQGLVHIRSAVHLYEMDPYVPLPNELYSGLDSVPQIWLSGYRTYHASTRREMLERAIAWNTCVKLKKNGSELRFLPKEIVESNGGQWYVFGVSSLDERSLFPEQWEEMQLILPGINDK